MKRQATYWKKIIEKHISDKEKHISDKKTCIQNIIFKTLKAQQQGNKKPN